MPLRKLLTSTSDSQRCKLLSEVFAKYTQHYLSIGRTYYNQMLFLFNLMNPKSKSINILPNLKLIICINRYIGSDETSYNVKLEYEVDNSKAYTASLENINSNRITSKMVIFPSKRELLYADNQYYKYDPAKKNGFLYDPILKLKTRWRFAGIFCDSLHCMSEDIRTHSKSLFHEVITYPSIHNTYIKLIYNKELSLQYNTNQAVYRIIISNANAVSNHDNDNYDEFEIIAELTSDDVRLYIHGISTFYENIIINYIKSNQTVMNILKNNINIF